MKIMLIDCCYCGEKFGMDNAFRKKLMNRFLRVAKKHTMLKLPVLLSLTVVLCLYHAAMYISANGKRFACACCALMFFAVSSSFSFPVFSDNAGFVSVAAVSGRQTETSDLAYTYTEESDVDLAQNRREDDVPAELFEDEAAEEYGDEDVEHMGEAEKYTSDEILRNNEGFSERRGEEEEVAQSVSFDKEDWRLVLINKQHPIPEDYTFELGNIKGVSGNMRCDERIVDDLLSMLKSAKENGINLTICSPYRDLKHQETLFNRKIRMYMGRGMSYMEAYKVASQAVTVPGASEHQIGLALDIVCDTYTVLDEGFGETPAGKWLAAHSCEFGFILRYPEGKEYITSIEYEPWHFRYVGKEAATIIMREGITLEEFTERYL